MEQLSKLNRNRSWLKEEDDMLRRQINAQPKQNWKGVAAKSGLKRSANSCRLRYINHLIPRSRPGKLTPVEKLLTLKFRSQWGGKNWWSKIAKHLLPGRRDNDLKNFWHTLAKRADREGRDADSEAIRTSAELVESIKASGKFTMDYAPLISADAYDLLNRMLPDLGDGGSSSIVTDGPVASFDVSYTDFGPGRIGHTLFSEIGPEVDQLIPQCVVTPQSRVAVEQQLENGFSTGLFYYGGGPGSDPVPAAEPGNPYSSAPQIHVPVQQSELFHHGGGPTAFNQVPAAALGRSYTETNNQGLSHMQVTSIDSVHVNTYVDVPQIRAPPVEQHQQLGFDSGFFNHDGGPIGVNKATAEEAALGPTTSNEVDTACSDAEEELGENKAFADYFDFAGFF